MQKRVDFARLSGTLGLGLVILLAAAPGPVLAQSPPSQGSARPKVQPPPLFPRHRRGIYRDNQGLEVVDATPQSPPLDTDDPGVPDEGEYEINLTTRGDLSKGEQTVDLLFVDANYGLLPAIAGHELPTQLKFEFPVRAAREHGDPYTLGVGAAKFGVKLNFYSNENSGVSLSFYPQVEFEAPGTGSARKGLADPGQTVVLPLLVMKEFRYLTFVANGGVMIPVHAPGRETQATFAAGVGRAFTRKLAAMMEVRNESAIDFTRNHLFFISGGLIYAVRKVIVYAHLGRTLFSDDGFAHT